MISTTGRVRLLDPHTVNQIAAGEVVERPASAIKELVENALDAGATRVEVDLVDSGKTKIRVSDNGCGMSPEDAVAALQRHATSKISSVEDLSIVTSLGFRGEALPSIGAVSHMRLSTGTEDGLRTVLDIEGGQITKRPGGAGPRGTEIVVEDLFYNTPARLKFLKSDTTELGVCLENLYRYALSNPSVAFAVTHNGQSAIVTTGSGDLLETIAEIWGREAARSLAETETHTAGVTVRGFVSPPHFTKPTRAFQYLYVNGRPVKSRTLTAALDQAYRDLTPERRYPVIVLMLEIEPSRVDVNVSPTKSEVKFQHEGQAFDAVRYAVRAALMDHGMVPNAAGIAAANEALAQIHQSQVFETQLLSYTGLSNPLEASFLAQSPLSESPVPEMPSSFSVQSDRYPFGELVDGLRVLGQAMNTFIIAETRKGIVIIDQHVAHERVLYEYLCGLKGPTAIEKQSLLAPETLHLDRRSALLLADRIDEVVKVGFDIEAFGGESFVVRSAPAALRGKDPLRVLRDLVDELVESTVSRKLVPTREQIWIMSSCKMAVKAGDPLSHAEMEKLIVDLASTENPYLCPHGRPITIVLSRDELLRKFKRT